MDELRRRRARILAEEPGRVPLEEEEELLVLSRFRSRLLRAQQEMERTGYGALLELRVPSSLGMWIARDLRNEGRAAESRALAENVRAGLERDGYYLSYYWGLERLAEIEMSIGSSYTDEDEPERAEVELKKAVERLEGIEERLRDLGAGGRQLAAVRSMRCTALVSLAVNANVKQKDPEEGARLLRAGLRVAQGRLHARVAGLLSRARWTGRRSACAVARDQALAAAVLQHGVHLRPAG